MKNRSSIWISIFSTSCLCLRFL